MRADGPPETAMLVIRSFDELIALAAAKRDLQTRTALEADVRLVRFEDGRLEIALEPSARKTLVNDLARKLTEWTGRRWMVVVSAEPGAPTVRAQGAARQGELEQGVRADPLVQAVLRRFPGAEIVGVRRRGDAPAVDDTAVPPADPDEPAPNPEDYGASDKDDQ
jgi:DNA polymerase III subunit gamma/tau